MSRDDICAVAGEIDSHLLSAADDVAWWQATLAIERQLKHDGRTRVAASAACAASRAVVSAAEACGIDLPDTAVTAVARAAGHIARGLVAGDAAEAHLGHLLRDFSPVLRRLAAA